MPLLRIYTNQEPSTSEARRELLGAASSKTAELLGKPERVVMVSLETGRDLLFAGSDSPAAFVELASLGLPEERTGDLSAGLSALLAEGLGVPQDRMFLHFHNMPPHLWGTNGTTFG